MVRPAWARSRGWKSSRKLVTANEAKPNCARVTERGGGSVERSREPMKKIRSQDDPDQGEQAFDCEAFVTNERGRRFGCAVKDHVLTGDLSTYA